MLPDWSFARDWALLHRLFGDKLPGAANWALANAERLRLTVILDALHARLAGLTREDLEWLLRDCAHPESDARRDDFTSRLDPNFADRLAEVDHRRRCAFVGQLDGDDAIRAVGRYEATGSGEAEIAFLIEDEFQGHGLGRELFELLAANAARNGITRFTAMVLPENRKMLTMFESMGRPISVRSDGTTLLVELELAA